MSWFGRAARADEPAGVIVTAVLLAPGEPLRVLRGHAAVGQSFPSLTRDFLPSSWGTYTPSVWDVLLYTGTFGLFFTLMLLFIRFVPMINIYEMRHLLHKEHAHGSHAPGHDMHHGTGDQHSVQASNKPATGRSKQ